mgnify:CR=1 FL=1|jgi:hypothetical protein
MIVLIGINMSGGSKYAMTINQRSIHAYAQGVSVAEEVLSSNLKTSCTCMDIGCDHGEVITLPRDALQL